MGDSTPSRRAPQRAKSNFLTRTAIDEAAQLNCQSVSTPAVRNRAKAASSTPSSEPGNPYEPRTHASRPEPYRHELTKKVLGLRSDSTSTSRRSISSRRRSGRGVESPGGTARAKSQYGGNGKGRDGNADTSTPRIGALPRPVGGSQKLGTFSGVFVPTSLNVLSILMFLRFGFILGQSGVLAMMGMLIASYLINLITTLSISAIATNGTVRGGGAYYLISRSLGPEFGGSIGVVFYLGFVFNTGMNAVGLIDCLKHNFGAVSGDWSNWVPEGFWWQYLWASIVLVICTGICLAGSSIFARASNGLLAILLIATFSIPVSALVRGPFENRRLGVEYTGISAKTFMGNLLPRLTKGAAGSQIKHRENFQDLFGILFPATGGIFAGASMSGDLKHPSKAIPKGTLSGLALTFSAYTLVILAMAATITRHSLYGNVNIIQDTNVSAVLVLLGEFATTFFSALMGVIGSAKLLQALARDKLIPGLSLFGQGTTKGDEPTYAIIVTFLVAQITMLFDINQIASFVTMTYLMTFLVTNLACFLLKISSAPNFRPSFHYFNWQTAAAGTVISGVMMFFVDSLSASGCVALLVFVFLLIHYTTPPKSWGDVSQSLIYHQVRKYLLRLRQEHVKFWRPQILLLINDPRRQYRLIQFCNSMKKGALYILGHVIVSQDFGAAVPEARRQQAAWIKYIDLSQVKAFVNIAISPAFEWGVRNIILSAGLGGMRPNIAVIGFYNLEEFRKSQPLVDIAETPSSEAPIKARSDSPGQESSNGQERENSKRSRKDSNDRRLEGLLPTDECRTEVAMSASSYVTILEDLLLRLQINVAVAKGFRDLEMPGSGCETLKKTIDLWPIQMSAEIAGDGDQSTNVLTTNFDTYTLILQLGCILDTVPSWKKFHTLRVAVFVEYESDVEEERGRVEDLLTNLRIRAEVLVFWLASGDLKTYEIIVNGVTPEDGEEAEKSVDDVLKDEEWWHEIQKIRGKRGETTASEQLAEVEDLLASPAWPGPAFLEGRRDQLTERFGGLKKLLWRPRRRHSSFSAITKLGVNLGMRTHRLNPAIVKDHITHGDASEDSDSSVSSDAISDDEDQHHLVSSASDGNLPSQQHFTYEDDDNPTPSTAMSHIRQSRRRSDADALLSSSHSSTRKEHASRPSSPPVKPHNPPLRPPAHRQSSQAKFSSKPVPATRIAPTEDGPGPSVMFTDTPSPLSGPSNRRSIYSQSVPSPRSPSSQPQSQQQSQASGFPLPSSIPLTFNDLPCRAQHLILNELMRAHSDQTVVVFTTLPSPVEGTCRSETESARYLADLECLCEGLPPVLLVHSNSLTVTMDL